MSCSHECLPELASRIFVPRRRLDYAAFSTERLSELSGVPEPTAREAMRLAMHKLPIKSRFVVRQDET